jgi:hypothetical protein
MSRKSNGLVFHSIAADRKMHKLEFQIKWLATSSNFLSICNWYWDLQNIEELQQTCR